MRERPPLHGPDNGEDNLLFPLERGMKLRLKREIPNEFLGDMRVVAGGEYKLFALQRVHNRKEMTTTTYAYLGPITATNEEVDAFTRENARSNTYRHLARVPLELVEGEAISEQ